MDALSTCEQVYDHILDNWLDILDEHEMERQHLRVLGLRLVP